MHSRDMTLEPIVTIEGTVGTYGLDPLHDGWCADDAGIVKTCKVSDVRETLNRWHDIGRTVKSIRAAQ